MVDQQTTPTPTAPVPAKQKPKMWIGPTVTGLGIKSNTIVRGGNMPQLQSLIDTKPMVKVLFVSADKVTLARQAMRTEGTIEHLAYKQVLELGKEAPKKSAIRKR
jgi:hypothetical protein